MDEDFIAGISYSVKKQMKEQRLLALQTQYFDFYMQRAAFIGNEMIPQANIIERKMNEVKSSYDTVSAIDIGTPPTA